MRFKEWLFLEEDGDGSDSDGGSGGSGSFWDLIYPSTAADYPYDVRNPRDHFFFQWRLRRGEEIGRPLHNIDNKEFQSRGYRSVESSTSPDGQEGFWTHKDDGDSPSTKVVNKQDLIWIGDGKDSKGAHSITGYHFANDVFGKHTMWGSYSKEPDKNLKNTFGDEISGDFPHIRDMNKFDDDWTKPEHRSIAESFRDWLEFTTGGGDFGGAGGYGTVMHGGIFGKPGEHLNTGAGGAKSKYQATDGDEGDDVKTDPDKMFGMKDRKSKLATRERKAKTIDKRSRKSQLVVPRPYY